MDRYTEILSFVLSADKGSFAGAAKELDVTPVIMGRRLDALEKRLGVSLMHRSTRGLNLTPQGEAYLTQCRHVLREIEAMDEAICAENTEIRGLLRIAAPAHFGRCHVATHAASFLEKYPNIELSFSLSDSACDLVQEGFDMAVRISLASPLDYVAIPLYSNRRVVCATPAYWAKNGIPETPDALVKHNCLAFNQHSGSPVWRFLEEGKLRDIIVRGNVACNDSELLFQWVKEGLGVSWRSTWEVESLLKNGQLQEVLQDFSIPDHPILAVYPKQRHLPQKARAFISHLKEIYKRKNYWKAA